MQSIRTHAGRETMSAKVRLEELGDEELISEALRETEGAEIFLDVLYRRYYAKVAKWCLRFTHGDRDAALDLAQDVFLRVHTRLGTFRFESRFSTWLYKVTRSVAINRIGAAQRRQADSLEELKEVKAWEPHDTMLSPEAAMERSEILHWLRRTVRQHLDPTEAEVLYRHHVGGSTLKAIGDSLGLTNRSGAKAHQVSAMRKLKRRFARWQLGHSP